MGSAMIRVVVLGCAAILLAGCEDPLAPERETALLAARGGPPQPSTDPQSTPSSASQIDLFWADNVSNETGWEIHRSTTGGSGTFSLLTRTAANVTFYSDLGLKPTTEYCYRVRWFRISGKKTTLGAFLTTTCATTFGPPNAASDVSATPGGFGIVDIVWISNSLILEGFRLERGAGSEGSWVKVEVVGSSLRSYRDFGRPAEQQVCYRLIAFNGFGESPPSNVDCTTPPAAPSQLGASSYDEQSISLSWVDNSAYEDGFEVQRADDALVWSVIATLPANGNAYIDHGVTANTRYWYQVRATKDGGFSQLSNRVSGAAASILPDAPSFVGATPYNSSIVSVSWATDSKLAEGFRLQRSTDGAATWVTTITTTTDQDSFYDEGRSSEQKVCYRVFAFNRVGDSPASNVACTIPPAGPTNLVGVSLDDQTIEYRWNDNSGIEDGYELWLISGGYGFYYPVSLPPNTASYQTSASEAVYGVVALKDGGFSDWAFPSDGTASALQNQAATVRRPPPSALRTPPVLKTQRKTLPPLQGQR